MARPKSDKPKKATKHIDIDVELHKELKELKKTRGESWVDLLSHLKGVSLPEVKKEEKKPTPKKEPKEKKPKAEKKASENGKKAKTAKVKKPKAVKKSEEDAKNAKTE